VKPIVIFLLIILCGCSSNHTNTAITKYKLSNKESVLISAPEMQYPKYLWNRGIEGYAIVSFDIDINGNTFNHHVRESEMGEYVSALAVEHVKKFKYSPKIVNGEPSIRSNVSVRISVCFPEHRNNKNFVFEHRSSNCDRLHPQQIAQAPRTSCAGQFSSRSFVVLLRKSIPQNYNLKTTA
jgi:TonB family protein